MPPDCPNAPSLEPFPLLRALTFAELTFGRNRDFYNRPTAIPAADDDASVALPIGSSDIAFGLSIARAVQEDLAVVIMFAAALHYIRRPRSHPYPHDKTNYSSLPFIKSMLD